MNTVDFFGKLKAKGIKGTAESIARRLNPPPDNKYTILLLTNRDSDNVGDQVIEACDISLIRAVMKNLNIPEEIYKINSRAASLVTQKYMATRDPALLQGAENTIANCDMIVFGGAPLFNYQYQNFYERTAVTLELAQKYHKPVIFSAIGVEGYDEDDEKCQRLKKTLNFDCVKQITTRDHYDLLEKYRTNESIHIQKVSDPAVFSKKVFEPFLEEKVSDPERKKKIGVFVLRSNGFRDNGVDFTRKQAATLWTDLSTELKKRDYDFEFLTSGHFGDEALLDHLIRKYGFTEKQTVFNINCPEDLLQKIYSYDGVIACRLHPSIISYALQVPAIGIVWNKKVTGFYNNVGYGERTVPVEGINPQALLDQLETVMSEGVSYDKEYLLTVYTTLFQGIKKALNLTDTDATPYTFEELWDNLPPYKGTTPGELNDKIRRKFRRTYGGYNGLFGSVGPLKKKVAELSEELEQYRDPNARDDSSNE